MVFNKDLGYDPDLWEECPEPEHFLAFGFFTRVGLTIVTVGLAGAFFWLLEARKEWGKVDKKDEKEKTLVSAEVDENQRPPPKPERRVSLDQYAAKIDEGLLEARRRSQSSEIRSPQRDVRSSRSVERKLRESSLNKNEVESLMRDKLQRESPRIEDRFLQESQNILQAPLPHGAFENEGTPHVDQRNLNLGRTPLQAEPPCVTPQSPEEPRDKESIEQQYRKLAKDLENKLLSEIEKLGLLKGRQNDKNAPRQIAEELQQRHEKEIKTAVEDLVNREAGGSKHIVDHFRKQLENQIEDAVWQYNHKLLNQQNPDYDGAQDLYETELTADEPPIWEPREEPDLGRHGEHFPTGVMHSPSAPEVDRIQQEDIWRRDDNQGPQSHQYLQPEEDIWQKPQNEGFVQKSFQDMEEEFTRRQEKPTQAYPQQQQQPEQDFQRIQQQQQQDPRRTQQQQQQDDSRDFHNQSARSASTPRSPEEIRQLGEEYPYGPPDPQAFKRGASEGAQSRFQVNQNPEKTDPPLNPVSQKKSSSSEEGFVKVYDYRDKQVPVESEGVSGVASPRPASYDAGSSVTADDIEFVQSMQNQEPQDYPEVFEDYETLKKHPESFEKGKRALQAPESPQNIQKLRLSDEGFEGFEPIQEQDIWQAREEVAQPPAVGPSQVKDAQKPKQIDPKEEAQVLELLQEYDFSKNSGEKPKKAHELPLPWEQELQITPEEGKSSPNISPRQLDYDIVEDFSPIAQSPQGPTSPQQPLSPQRRTPSQGPTSPHRSKSPKSPVQVFQPGENVAEFLFQQGKPTVEITDQNLGQTTVSYNDSQKAPSMEKQQSGYENIEDRNLQGQNAPEIPHGKNVVDEIPHLATADIYLQDAIDYMESQRPATSQSGGGFVIEEEMLESEKMSPPIQRKPDQENLPNLSDLEKQLRSQKHLSNEPPAKSFDKKESFEDPDDAVTSAPEIQSIEIPPDQMSENSSNFIENIPDHEFRPGSSRGQSPGILLSDPMLASPQQQKRPDSQSERSPEAPKLWRVSPIPDDQVSVSESIGTERHAYKTRKQSSLLSVLNVTSMQEMLLTLTSLEGLAAALRKAGLESTNLIFGIDYTASNKYQGEKSFAGRSLHSVENSKVENPYQQVIRIMGNSLASFASSGAIPVFGFGDSSTGDWSVFKLKKEEGQCKDLDEVLRIYNEVTPTVDLSGPTNFAPLIYEAIRICQRVQDYHILVIIADGQVTNERATRKAIVHACHYPLSIIVVGVGDGPWDMMRVFDESLPKRPWDNFHFVEFHEIMRASHPGESELAFAVQSLLEVPDQFNTVKRLGLLGDRTPRDPQ